MTTSNALGRVVARWLMRIEAARGFIQLVLFGGIFVNTGLEALDTYGYDEYARPFIVHSVLGVVVFAYVYVETGVWNQKNRDTKDMSTNYSGPNLLMRYQMQAVQLGALVEALGDDLDHDEAMDLLERRTVERWEGFRDGVDEDMLRDYDGGGSS